MSQFAHKLPEPDFQTPATELWIAAQRFSIADPDHVRPHLASLVEAREYINLAIQNANEGLS